MSNISPSKRKLAEKRQKTYICPGNDDSAITVHNTGKIMTFPRCQKYPCTCAYFRLLAPKYAELERQIQQEGGAT